jgi:hypothetical protein
MATAKEEFTITRRPRWAWMGEIKVEIECDPTSLQPVKLGLAVKAAFGNGASLDGARLDGASLDGASLVGASLDGARLVGASLDGASLDGASLDGARLVGASLDGASLVGARLDGASLDGARLDGASLVGARLVGARLDGASLDGARLDGASLVGASLDGASLDGARLDGASLVGASLPDEVLRPFKADLWATVLSLRAIPLEMRHLIAKLRAGQVDGHTYGQPGTDCACLVGTLAQPRNVGGEDLDHNSSRPAERWFMMIKPGDIPGAIGDDGKETGGGFAARKALEWTLELAEILGIDPDVAPVVSTEVEPA